MIIGFMFVSDYWFCHHIVDLLVDDYFLVTLQKRENSLPLSFWGFFYYSSSILWFS